MCLFYELQSILTITSAHNFGWTATMAGKSPWQGYTESRFLETETQIIANFIKLNIRAIKRQMQTPFY